MIPSTFGVSFCMTHHYNYICELSVNMLFSFFYRVVFFSFLILRALCNQQLTLTRARYGYNRFHIVQHDRIFAFIFKSETVIHLIFNCLLTAGSKVIVTSQKELQSSIFLYSFKYLKI